jgi:hypothetical protein
MRSAKIRTEATKDWAEETYYPNSVAFIELIAASIASRTAYQLCYQLVLGDSLVFHKRIPQDYRTDEKPALSPVYFLSGL